MEEDIKKGLKSIVRNTENRMAESVLKWRYKKEGKKIPNQLNIEKRSQQVADQAHEIISRSGRNIWKGIVKVYREKKDAGDKRD